MKTRMEHQILIRRVATDLEHVLEFMGVLKNPDTSETRRSKLLGTKYLPSLNGMVWQAKEEGEEPLDQSASVVFSSPSDRFPRSSNITSDPKTKFDLFQCLNRGGAYANEQEVRTCSMVLANPEFTNELRSFARRKPFQEIFRITEDQTQKSKGSGIRGPPGRPHLRGIPAREGRAGVSRSGDLESHG